MAGPIFWDLANAPSVDPVAVALGIANVVTPLVALGAGVRLRAAAGRTRPPAG